MLEQIFGNVALITSLIGLLPQVYKTYITKSASDVSMLMLINFLICSIAWIGYGFITESSFVVYSNIVGFFTCIVSIFQKKYYETI